ncbi:MAG: PEGA domain-containing protein, partial [Candidatus Cloacimonadota bacterium]
SIQVNSTPTGAQVFLDGSDTGRTTNTTLTNVSAGSHTVDLVMEGYED